jgi:sodium-dependent dicarboxylate transporter 2/3/5
MNRLNFFVKYQRASLSMLTLLLAILVYSSIPSEEYPKAPIVAFVVTIMAGFWIFEIIPIAVTSLFPLVLFPLFNVMDMSLTSSFYGKPIIFLFLGGFLLAFGLQESGLHRRIALNIVHFIGSDPIRLILGFMLASGFLSMWISNTASVMVMIPIALSIVEQARESNAKPEAVAVFALSLMLGIAYAADIGGMGTIIGTPPNLVFLELYTDLFPDNPPVGFLDWMIMALPVTIIFMGVGWLLLTRVIFNLTRIRLFEHTNVITEQLRSLGRVKHDEWWAGMIFLVAAILWITGSDIEITESLGFRGWRSWLNLPEVSDASIAVGAAIFLFVIPSKMKGKTTLLDWHIRKRVPWGILLLFGGGFAIAGSFEVSGLSRMIGEMFTRVDFHSPVVLVALINTVLTFLTELTSNTAMANLILPILAEASVALELDPRLLMIPATLSASCAFMTPIASPTQAIIFGTGFVSIRQMLRAGIWFNVAGIIIVTVVFMFFGILALGI